MAIANIDKLDKLNTGRVKLNQAIDQANTVQGQLDTIVIASGTSDAETIQARGGEPLLYNRLDKSDTQLADNMTDFSKSFYSTYLVAPLFIAHRGAENLVPENTLLSAEYASLVGFKAVECDIQLTIDGEWVVFHDDTVDAKTNGTGTIASMTLSQIKALNIDVSPIRTRYNNFKIPTLSEYLELCSSLNLEIMIEIKAGTAQDLSKVFDITKRLGITDKIYLAGNRSSLVYCKDNYTKNFKAMPLISLTNEEIDLVALTLPNSIVGVNYAGLTEGFANYIHSKSLQIAVWTIQPSNISLVDTYRKWGVRYIIGGVLQ